MKKLLLIVFLFSTTKFTFSQTYTLDPGNVDTVFAPFNDLTIFDIYPINISNNKILFKWTKISINVPTGWDYSFCDYGNCYVGIPNSGTMDSVDVGEMGLLGLNISPYSIPGQGIVKLYVYDANFPSDGDTVTWVVNSGALGYDEIVDENSIQIYPNPAKEIVFINSKYQGTISIYNLEGKLINSFTNFIGENTVDMSQYDSGLYIIEFTSESGVVRKKIIKE